MVRPKKAVAKADVPIAPAGAEMQCIKLAELPNWMAWLKLEDLPISVQVEALKQSWTEPQVISVTCIAASRLTGDKVTRLSSDSECTGALLYLFSKRVDAILMGDRALVRAEQDG